MFALPLAAVLAATPALDNDYVLVTRGQAVCEAADPARCGSRVVVALGPVAVESAGSVRALARGEVGVFGPTQSYRIDGREFLEVVIRPGHPPALPPPERIAPEKNALLHDGADFFVFEERLPPGETRARHSHSQRVVIQLNRTRLQQWPDGSAEVVVDTVPDRPSFSPPVVHRVRNIGDQPLFGIIVEFRPGDPPAAR
jgi:hypothetical protein